MTSIPFTEKGKLLQHNNIYQNDLKSHIPIDYILENIDSLYNIDNKNFFIIDAATGSGKSFTLPLAFYKYYENKRIIILQPKILTVNQLQNDFIIPDSHASDMSGTNFTLGKNLSVKSSLNNLNCKVDHCLTISSYGSFTKSVERNKEHLYKNDVIILDEIHEDSPEVIDLLLYLHYINKQQKLPLIILTSATLNVQLFLSYFNSTLENYFKVAGKSYSKVINYLNKPTSNVNTSIYEILKKIINTDDDKHDILIFISSVIDIKNIKDDKIISSLGIDIVGLNRDYILTKNKDYVDFYENNEKDLKKRKRMIVLSSPVSETGVTFNYLKYVINIGYEMRKEYIPYLNSYVFYKGVSSLSSEIQRNGRVGRRFEGIAYNLYTEDAKKLLNFDKTPSLITNNITFKILINFNKMYYINSIPFELVYSGLYNLVILNFVSITCDIAELRNCIKYVDNEGYVIDGTITKLGLIAKKIIINLDNIDSELISINDIKLILSSLAFNININDIVTSLLMANIYTSKKPLPNTDNDYIELLKIYKNTVKKKVNLFDKTRNSELYIKTKIIEVAYYKHIILKSLYKSGITLSTDKSIDILTTDKKKIYLINKLFYMSYIDKIVLNKRHKNYYINCDIFDKFVTNKFIIKKSLSTNLFNIKPNYKIICK